MNGSTIVWALDPGGAVLNLPAASAVRQNFAFFVTEKEAWAAAATLLDANSADLQKAADDSKAAANAARAQAAKP